MERNMQRLRARDISGELNMPRHLYQKSLGQSDQYALPQYLQKTFLKSLDSYNSDATYDILKGRLTCMEWHPSRQNTLALGTNRDVVMLWDYCEESLVKSQAEAPISSMKNFNTVGAIKFCPTDTSKIYVASGNCNITLRSFEGLPPEVLGYPPVYEYHQWRFCNHHCCLDVSLRHRMLVTSKNDGSLLLLGLDGTKIFNEVLHYGKVTHAEFCPRDWQLATSSLDQTVKLWDLRNIKNKNSCLHEMAHDHAVYSVYFSPTLPTRLLTTDYTNEIRIYNSTDFSKPHVILDEQGRHMDDVIFKATWHPIHNLIMVGHYSEDSTFINEDEEILDFFEADTGILVQQLSVYCEYEFLYLNKFNEMGDVLASMMGYGVAIWQPNESEMQE